LYKYENDEKLIKQDKLEKTLNHIDDREISQWGSNALMNSNHGRQDDMNAHLVRIELQRDQSLLQWKKIGILFLSYFGILMLSLIRGSHHFKSLIGVET
jgi:hypothetical protein